MPVPSSHNIHDDKSCHRLQISAEYAVHLQNDRASIRVQSGFHIPNQSKSTCSNIPTNLLTAFSSIYRSDSSYHKHPSCQSLEQINPAILFAVHRPFSHNRSPVRTASFLHNITQRIFHQMDSHS